MTVPSNRITRESDPDTWQSLYDQWLEEKKPGYVVRHAGGLSWKVVQTAEGMIAFDPQDDKALYESTSF